MKHIQFFLLMLTILLSNIQAQNTYTITANTTWSSKNYPTNSGKSSVFNISSGVTLTIDQKNVTCSQCSFNGGILQITQNISCQGCSFSNDNISLSGVSMTLNGSSTFSKVSLIVNGAGTEVANGSVTLSSSTFAFNGSSGYTNNGGQLDMTASVMYFYDNTSFLANVGPVNLRSGSLIIAGNGAATSHSFVKFNGAGLDIFDNTSGIVLSNTNNYYYNWNAFTSKSNNKTYTTTYPAAPSKQNCGGSGQNACGGYSTPVVYGPATFNYGGVTSSSSATLLPVLLTDFTVSALSDNQVEINWSTQMEDNASYFSIEKSSNGLTWEDIGQVAAKGNTPTVTQYHFLDNGPSVSVAYYRLKMVDLDNKWTYSDIQVVRLAPVARIGLYPNPARDFVQLAFPQSVSGDISLELYNQSGQLVLRNGLHSAGGGNFSISVGQLVPGIYYVKISAKGGLLQTGKLVLSR